MKLLKIHSTSYDFISSDTIYYIEADGKYSKIHILNEEIKEKKFENGFKRIEYIEYSLETVTAKNSLTELKKGLPRNFLRVNRFNILHPQKVRSIKKNEIHFDVGLKRVLKGKLRLY